MGKRDVVICMSLAYAIVVWSSEAEEKLVSSSPVTRSPVVHSPLHQEEIHRVISGKSSIFGTSYTPAERAIMQQRHSSSDGTSPVTDRAESNVSPFSSSFKSQDASVVLDPSEHAHAFRNIKEQKVIVGRQRPGQSMGVISYKNGVITITSNDGSDFYYHGSGIPGLIDKLAEGTKYAGDVIHIRDDQGRKWKFQKITADQHKGIRSDYIRGSMVAS